MHTIIIIFIMKDTLFSIFTDFILFKQLIFNLYCDLNVIKIILRYTKWYYECYGILL